MGTERRARASYSYPTAKTCLGRNCAFITRSVSLFGSRTIPDASAIDSSLVRKVNGVPNTHMYLLKTNQDLLKNIFTNVKQLSNLRCGSNLYSTTSRTEAAKEEIKPQKSKGWEKAKTEESYRSFRGGCSWTFSSPRKSGSKRESSNS